MAENKKTVNLTNIIFLIGLISVTLFFVIFTLFMVAKPFEINNYSQMNEITYTELTTSSTNKHNEYYVYVYDEKNIDCIELLPAILDYANYARTHDSASPIFIINAKNPENKSNTYTIPTLVYVKDKAASTTYTTYSKIVNQLSSISK